MTTSVDGGILSRTGRGGGGREATQRQPMATQRRPRIPAKHSRACALVQEPPGAAQYAGQLRISRGKQPLCEATLPGLSPRSRTTRRLPVHWGLADSQREQPQLEIWRRSQGNARQHVGVLGLIVVSTVSSPMGPTAADLLDFEESLKSLKLPWGPATTCIPSESWCCQPLIFARWAGGSRKWSITLHAMAEPLSVEGP
jgi:hypothetical protein